MQISVSITKHHSLCRFLDVQLLQGEQDALGVGFVLRHITAAHNHVKDLRKAVRLQNSIYNYPVARRNNTQTLTSRTQQAKDLLNAFVKWCLWQPGNGMGLCVGIEGGECCRW